MSGYFGFGGSFPAIMKIMIAAVAAALAVGVCVFLLFLPRTVRRIKAKRKRGRGTVRKERSRTSHISESAVIGSMLRDDPDYSAERLRTYVGGVYTDLAGAIEDDDPARVRRAVCDELLESLAAKELDRIGTDIHILDIAHAAYRREGGCDYLSVSVHAHSTLGGVRTSRTDMLAFRRDTGISSDDCFSLPRGACLHCGAPDPGARCPYCGSIFRAGKYGWQLLSLTPHISSAERN